MPGNVKVIPPKKTKSLDARSAAERRNKIQERRQTGMPTRNKIQALLSRDDRMADIEEAKAKNMARFGDDDDDIPARVRPSEKVLTPGPGAIGFVEPIGALDALDDDGESAVRRRLKLQKRRPTGVQGLSEAERLSLFAVHDSEDKRESEIPSKPTKVINVNAREVTRLTMEERLERNEFQACPHTEDSWCTCDNRHQGRHATFVDPQQPPYSIWHAGTDYALIQLPIGVEHNDDTDEVDEIPVEVFNLTGENGFCVQMCNYGARITSILMPDSEGLVEEVMLSFPNINYVQHYEGHCLGGLLGRMVGNIPRGEVRGEKRFCAQLDLNDINYHSHGGVHDSFDRVLWQVAVAGNELVFTMLSPDGAAGYPGAALATARYSVRPPNTLVMRLTVTCTKPCPICPALRIPLNLAGHGTGKMGMLEHVVTVNAEEHYEMDPIERLATGKKQLVAGTVNDLRIPRSMAKLHPHAPWPGYRVLFKIDSPKVENSEDKDRPEEDEDAPLPLICKLYHPESRRAVEVFSNQPVLYFETARWTLTVDPEDKHEEEERERLKRYNEGLGSKMPEKSILTAQTSSLKSDIATFPQSLEKNEGGPGSLSKQGSMSGRVSARSSGATQERFSELSQGARHSNTPKSGKNLREELDKKFPNRNTRFPTITEERKVAIPVEERGVASEKSRKRIILFGMDDVKIMEDDEDMTVELPEAPPVVGRSLFPYYRCGAITLQPQLEPIFFAERHRGVGGMPPDVTKVLLRPGQQRVYAVTFRFSIVPKLPKPRRKRNKEEVKYKEPGESLADTLARSDTCDWERFKEPEVVPEENRQLPQRIGDLEADRCSLESLDRRMPDKAQNRVFLGPPTAEVPEPARLIKPSLSQTYAPSLIPDVPKPARPKKPCGWTTKRGLVRCRPFGYSPA